MCRGLDLKQSYQDSMFEVMRLVRSQLVTLESTGTVVAWEVIDLRLKSKQRFCRW